MPYFTAMAGRSLSALLRDAADQPKMLQSFLLNQCERLDDRFRREEVTTAVILAASVSAIFAEALTRFASRGQTELAEWRALGIDGLVLAFAVALVIVGSVYLLLRLRQLRLEMSLVRLHFIHASLAAEDAGSPGEGAPAATAAGGVSTRSINSDANE